MNFVNERDEKEGRPEEAPERLSLEAEIHLRGFVTEILRGASASDPNRNVDNAAVNLWGFLVEAGKPDCTISRSSFRRAMEEMIRDIRGIHDPKREFDPVHYAQGEVASSAGKVLAERLSGQKMQLFRATSALNASIKAYVKQLRARHEAGHAVERESGPTP